MPMITKEMVLEGYRHRIEIPAPEYGEQAFFSIMSPSITEIAEARALRIKLSGVKGEVKPSEIDLAKALTAEETVKVFFVSKALTSATGKKWSLEDVQKINPVVFKRIWKQVDMLIGFSEEAEEQIKNFPNQPRDKS